MAEYHKNLSVRNSKNERIELTPVSLPANGEARLSAQQFEAICGRLPRNIRELRPEVLKYLLEEIIDRNEVAKFLAPKDYVSPNDLLSQVRSISERTGESYLVPLGASIGAVSAGRSNDDIWDESKKFQNLVNLHRALRVFSLTELRESHETQEVLRREFYLTPDELLAHVKEAAIEDRVGVLKVTRARPRTHLIPDAEMAAAYCKLPVVFNCEQGSYIVFPSKPEDLTFTDFEPALREGTQLVRGAKLVAGLQELRGEGSFAERLAWLAELERACDDSKTSPMAKLSEDDLTKVREVFLSVDGLSAEEQYPVLQYPDDAFRTYESVTRHLLFVLQSDGIPYGAAAYLEDYQERFPELFLESSE